VNRLFLSVTLVFTTLLLCVQIRTDPPAVPALPSPIAHPGTRFQAFDVFVDPRGSSLAVYQVEIRQRAGTTDHAAKIVGIEGGESTTFSAAPYFDPKAIQNDRVILGALASPTGAAPPTTRTRIARVHVMFEGELPKWDVDLQVAGDAAGRTFFAVGSVELAEADPGAQ